MLLAIGLAGALGAATRYVLAEMVARRQRGELPLATFLINVSGAFALGLVLTMGAGAPGLWATLHSVVGAGFLGGYTTFSTLSFETHALARRGRPSHAALYALCTLLAGVLAAGVGIALGRLA